MGLVLDDATVAAMMQKKMAVKVKVRVATSVAAVPMKMKVRVRVAALVAVAGRLPESESESPVGELEPLSREVWCTLGTKAPVRKPCYGLT